MLSAPSKMWGPLLLFSSNPKKNQRSKTEGEKKEICFWFKLILFLYINIKVSFILVFPLTPHGSMYSLGLLFRPDKQGFFVYSNYCLRIVPNVTRLSMRTRAGRSGDVMRGNSDQLPEHMLMHCSSGNHQPSIWLLLMEVEYILKIAYKNAQW